jgi:hypothetical protein
MSVDINVSITEDIVDIIATPTVNIVNVTNSASIDPGLYDLSEFTNTSGNPFVRTSGLSSYVPASRTLTINGTTQDLSANRTFTISTGLSVGTTPIASGTIGRVLFEGTGNVLQQSGNLFWDGTNNRLGIGTSTPSSQIDVFESNPIISTRIASTGIGKFNYLNSAGTSEFAGIHLNAFSGEMRMYTNTTYFPTFYSSNAERMRIATTGNVLINTTTDVGYKLDVNGIARVQSSVELSNNGIYKFGPLVGLYATTDNGLSSNSGAGNLFLGYYAAGDTGYIGTTVTLGRLSNVSLSATSGLQEMVRVTGNFAPTSGTALFNALQLNHTINQTGGANGITRGLYINPTLTSAADFRAIETTAGNVLFNGGNVGIGTSTPTQALHVNGNIFVQGSADSANGIVVSNNCFIAFANLSNVLGSRIRGTGNAFLFQDNASNTRALITTQGAGGFSYFANGGGNVGIGTTTDAGFKLDVNGTARVATSIQSLGFFINAALEIGMRSAATAIRISTNDNGANIIANNVPFFTFGNNGTVINRTSGTGKWFEVTSFVSFAPTSGTCTMDWMSVSPTINQTGGANGITRGLYINPTLTAAADFRAIETARGNVVFGNLPTSPVGLPTGAIWNNLGILSIV